MATLPGQRTQFTWALNQYNQAEDAEKQAYFAKRMAKYIATVAALALATITVQAEPKNLGVACTMMAFSIEAITDEHVNYPDEPRDELVARLVAEMLASPASVGQSPERLIMISGKFVDYVEDHPGLSPAAMKTQFMADCTSFKLPW